MKIETKYNVGDELYFLENNKVIIKEILNATIHINDNNIIDIIYGYYKYSKDTMGSCPILYINETQVFFTKEELLKSL